MATKSIKKITKDVIASIPPKEYFEDYISREIAGELSEFDIFDAARSNKDNVLIEGPTGLGKTSAVLAYAAREQRRFCSVPSNIGIEPSQLFGKYVPNPEGGFEWVDGPVTDVVRNGGVLLINEVNFMPERVATVLFGLLDKRRTIQLLDHKGETIHAHDDLLVIADMNPDYEGTRPLNKAFRNRFAIQMAWEYDPILEQGLLISPALIEMAGKFRQAQRQGAYGTPVATNMLQEFERMTLNLGIEFAALNFINHFPAEERGPARLVVEAFTPRLAEEIVTKDADLPPTHPLWKIRAQSPNGYADPQWGIKGMDWVYEEDDDPEVAVNEEDGDED